MRIEVISEGKETGKTTLIALIQDMLRGYGVNTDVQGVEAEAVARKLIGDDSFDLQVRTVALYLRGLASVRLCVAISNGTAKKRATVMALIFRLLAKHEIPAKVLGADPKRALKLLHGDPVKMFLRAKKLTDTPITLAEVHSRPSVASVVLGLPSQYRE